MKKLLSIIIISLLVWYTCILPVAAATPSIVVDGGAVAGGGVAGGTNAKGDLAAVLAALSLASQGVDINITDSSITKTDFILDKLKEYADFVGITFQQLVDTWTENVKVLADGTIGFGLDSSRSILQWISYLVHNDSILNPAENGSVVKLDNISCPVLLPGESIDFMVDSDGDILTIQNASNYTYSIFYEGGDNYRFYIITNNNHIIYRIFRNHSFSSSNNTTTQNLNGIYYYSFYVVHSSVVSDALVPEVPNALDAISRLNGEFKVELNMPVQDGFIGDSTNIDLNDFKPSPDHLNVIDPGLHLDGIAVSSGASGTVPIKSYINALKDAINGNDASIQVNDLDNGIVQDVPITGYDPFQSTTISEDDSSNVSSGLDIIDDDQFPTAEETQQYLHHMQFNLINVFPFCIPFDIVNLLSKLDVEPVTPHVNLSFPNPVLDNPIVFDLDFSQWDGVAQVVRNAELVAFVVGLAMVTRNLIRG